MNILVGIILVVSFGACSILDRLKEPTPTRPSVNENDDAVSRFEISRHPHIELLASCKGEFWIPTGKLWGIPLPPIPNFVGIFRFFIGKRRPADLSLHIGPVSEGMFDWQDVVIEIWVSGKPLKPMMYKDNSDDLFADRIYRFEPQTTCGDIANSFILVSIIGVSTSPVVGKVRCNL